MENSKDPFCKDIFEQAYKDLGTTHGRLKYLVVGIIYNRGTFTAQEYGSLPSEAEFPLARDPLLGHLAQISSNLRSQPLSSFELGRKTLDDMVSAQTAFLVSFDGPQTLAISI